LHYEKIFRADPAFLRYRICKFILGNIIGLFFAPLFLVLSFMGSFSAADGASLSLPKLGIFAISLGLALLYFFMTAVFTFLIFQIDYRMRWYLLDENSLRIREGVFDIKEMTVTFSKVQSLYVTQGPLQKFFGIADIKIETAGGRLKTGIEERKEGREFSSEFHRASIKGVKNYEEIKNIVMQKLKRINDTGLGASEKFSPVENSNPIKTILLKDIRAEFTIFAKLASDL